MSDLTIRKVLSKIEDGEIRIPSFQRDFVWNSEQIAFLLDSIYKEIPIGSVFLWKTKEKLKSEKDFGNFTLPEPKVDYPIQYVLDGQQRLTSLFSVFQTSLIPNKNNHDWMEIYFDLDADDNTQDSMFIPLLDKDVDLKRHFPMRCLYDSVEYRKATSSLTSNQAAIIDGVQEKFKEYTIPQQEIETSDKAKIAIVFERINRAGTELDTFQLLSAWTWSSEFNLVDEIEKLTDELDIHGFGDLQDDKDLIMKCCSGVILNEASPKAIMSLNGEIVRNKFDEISTGIKGAVDFLRNELNVSSLKVMPYPAMLVSLTKFFASSKANGSLYTDVQRKELLRWFWKSCFSRRYTNGVTDRHRTDIKSMEKLRADENHKISNFQCNIDSTFFTDHKFTLGTVNTKTFILLLSSLKPQSFISGGKVDLEKVLNNVSRAEFHHIFPKKYLERQGIDKKKINMLSNFCFLNNSDNQKIKDKKPSDYINLIPKPGRVERLGSHLCTESHFNMTYDKFYEDRTLKLLAAANKLME